MQDTSPTCTASSLWPMTYALCPRPVYHVLEEEGHVTLAWPPLPVPPDEAVELPDIDRDRETEGSRDREVERQRDRETEKLRDRETETHTHTERHRQRPISDAQKTAFEML
eukprot:1980676-Rhodomonas_salina.3